jgi:hypothetical protein
MNKVRRLDIIESFEQLRDNFIRFNSEIKGRIIPVDKVKQFYAWFYLPSNNLLGPSKYIKYINMNYESYNYFDELKYCHVTEQGFHGKVSDIQKYEWFKDVEKDSELHEELIKRTKVFSGAEWL